MDKFEIARIVEEYGFIRGYVNEEKEPYSWKIKPDEYTVIDLIIGNSNVYLRVDHKSDYYKDSEKWYTSILIHRHRFHTEEELRFLLTGNVEVRMHLQNVSEEDY